MIFDLRSSESSESLGKTEDLDRRVSSYELGYLGFWKGGRIDSDWKDLPVVKRVVLRVIHTLGLCMGGKTDLRPFSRSAPLLTVNMQ